MIVRYNFQKDGKNFVKHYSDEHKYIRKVGTDEEYIEAIDLDFVGYRYEETDKVIEDEVEENTEEQLTE